VRLGLDQLDDALIVVSSPGGLTSYPGAPSLSRFCRRPEPPAETFAQAADLGSGAGTLPGRRRLRVDRVARPAVRAAALLGVARNLKGA
jgi:hypothetical protein